MLDLRISTVIRSIPVLILILFLSISTQAQYSGGTGEPNNPYQIAEPNDWVELMHTSKDWDECFILMGDIDVNGIYLMGIGTFTGIFDGNDCVIYNVVKYGSLFGAVGINGQVKNLVLENIQITGYENVGGLVERNYGTISNCFTTGTVSGAYDYFGGLVGINYGNITDSKSTCTVSGDWYIGGLVGNNEGNVTNCSSSGTVSGDDYYVGGLVGRNTGAVINCNSTSTVSGGKGCQYIGGLVGSNFDGGTISNCFSTGTVSGDIVKYYSSDYIGGLVGTNGGNITNCYSNASVTGNRHLGGLIGRNNGTITNCYSTGKVIGDYYIGGLVGDGEGYVLNCIWDTENSEQYESDGGIGLDTSDMMNPLTLGLNGFCNDPNWVLDTGNDYPRLAWQGTPGDVIPEPDMDWILGDGKPETPYEIDSAEKLIMISKASVLWDRSFVLDDDVDLDPNVKGCKIFKSPV
ncbi:MAG: hypothetical protein JXB49_21145, partial [Bacteroidales bacterium]|nr:hypothetical protein [Bacteroidales bacterium]